MAKVARGSAKIIQRTMELFGGPCKLNKVPLPPPPYTGWGRARHLALSRYRATEAARAPRTATLAPRGAGEISPAISAARAGGGVPGTRSAGGTGRLAT